MKKFLKNLIIKILDIIIWIAIILAAILLLYSLRNTKFLEVFHVATGIIFPIILISLLVLEIKEKSYNRFVSILKIIGNIAFYASIACSFIYAAGDGGMSMVNNPAFINIIALFLGSSIVSAYRKQKKKRINKILNK